MSRTAPSRLVARVPLRLVDPARPLDLLAEERLEVPQRRQRQRGRAARHAQRQGRLLLLRQVQQRRRRGGPAGGRARDGRQRERVQHGEDGAAGVVKAG